MKKGFRKLLTFLLVFSMIAGMGVSIAAQGTYKVTYNSGDGDKAESYTSGTTVTVASADEGYGWELNGNDIDLQHPVGTVYKPGETFTMPENNINFKKIKLVVPPPTEYTLTINYEYEDGSEAATSYTEDLIAGAPYSVTSPVVGGYTADDLVVEGTMPESDRTITVVYTENENPPPSPERYTVTFIDHDGEVLKTQRVNRGNSATPPGNPTRAGWEFREWDGNWTNVRRDEIVTARYSEIEVIEEPPVPEAPPVVVPPIVEVPAEPVPQAPVLPKTGTFGAGEAAGIGALLMAIGLLIRKKKDA